MDATKKPRKRGTIVRLGDAKAVHGRLAPIEAIASSIAKSRAAGNPPDILDRMMRDRMAGADFAERYRVESDARVLGIAARAVAHSDQLREEGKKGGKANALAHGYTATERAEWIKLANEMRVKKPARTARDMAKAVAKKRRLPERAEDSIRKHLGKFLGK